MYSVGTAVVDGLRIRYLKAGSGPPVIFIHGLGGRAEAWLYQLSRLRGKYTGVALDLRGFGESEKPPVTPTLGDFARDVIGVLDWIGVDKTILVGSSMGGMVALKAYEAEPKRIRMMVLSNTAPRVRIDLSILERVASGDREASRIIASRLTQARASFDRLVDADPRYLLRVARMINREDLTGLLHRVHVPTLLIAGELDVITPPRVMEEMASRMPNAVLRIIAGAGHLSHIEKPREYTRLLMQYISTHS